MHPCQLILISIYNDLGTEVDRSDDKHLKTDAFLRCGDLINSWNLTSINEDDLKVTAILPGTFENIIMAFIKNSDPQIREELNYLKQIAIAYDELNTTNNPAVLYNLLDNAPDYFKPFIITNDDDMDFEEFLQ